MVSFSKRTPRFRVRMRDIGLRFTEGAQLVDFVVAIDAGSGAHTGNAARERAAPIHVDEAARVALVHFIVVPPNARADFQRVEAAGVECRVEVALDVRLRRGVVVDDLHGRRIRGQHAALEARGNSGNSGSGRPIAIRRR
jgi:hypothetical protein